MLFLKSSGREKRKINLSSTIYIFISLIFLMFAFMQSFNYGQYFRDYSNYIAYFKYANINYIYDSFSRGGWSVFLLNMFSDEFGWKTYAILCSFLMKPEACIPFTVLFLNTLIVISLRKLRMPFLSLFLWIILPVGFAMTGLLQIRQGLAFSVFMFTFLSYSRPILASILAASIHTTFIIPLLFFILNRVVKKKWLIIVSMVTLSIFLALLINNYYTLVAGRRASNYALDEVGTGLYCIFESFILVVPSIIWLLSSRKWNQVAVVHVGLFIWLFACLIFFTLGMSRVSYYMWLLLIPLLNFFENTKFNRQYFLILSIFIGYVCIRAYFIGFYQTIFIPHPIFFGLM